MTYEEYITKHNLHLDLTWKGFEVRPAATKDDKPWPGFKWGYRVFKSGTGRREDGIQLGVSGDYTQGIGHGELNSKWKTQGSLRYDPKIGLCYVLHSGAAFCVVKQGKETGTERPWLQFEDPDMRMFYGPTFYVTRPTFPDILDSLRNDAECAYPTFEEFAAALGYDPDSRSAEKTYLACCEIKPKLRGLVGGKGMVELLEEVERL